MFYSKERLCNRDPIITPADENSYSQQDKSLFLAQARSMRREIPILYSSRVTVFFVHLELNGLLQSNEEPFNRNL